MSIEFEDVSESFRRVKIAGRLDIPGTDAIGLKFSTFTTTAARRIVVDLTAVTFLASIGIRSFVTNAKAVHQKGGKMVLYVGDNEQVRKTLESTGIDMMIPMFSSLQEADAAAMA